PLSTVSVGGLSLPFAGGFYFRALPYAATNKILASKAQRGERVVMYFHPWEFVPNHPQPMSARARERVSHYTGLRGVRQKFRRLLTDHSFGPLWVGGDHAH